MKPTGPDCHVVAMPYPGRGHVNAMMNVCNQISSQKPDIHVTFVVTEEWLGFIGSEPRPDNIVLAAVPNVIPSEHGRANDFPGFLEAVNTRLSAPFEELLERLQPMPSVIIVDSFISWGPTVGNKRNIPVASLFPMPASVFSMFHHFELLRRNGHFPADLSERGNELVDYIPGVPTTRLADLTTIFYGNGLKVLPGVLDSLSDVSKVQYLLFTSAYELESSVFDSLKSQFPFPVYPIGPSIPYSDLETSSPKNVPNYIQWLDNQPKGSVLYISLGSFLSVSTPQLDEIVAGVNNSGVKYIWVSRGDASRIKIGCDINGDKNGFVVPWCDQLRVLTHSSVGAFLTHCGWNSTLEAVFSGVPMLTFPIFWDQIPNSKRIVEDWKIGIRVRKEVFGGDHVESLVTREEIEEIVRRFFNSENDDVIAMRMRAKKLKEACRGAISKGGSSYRNLDAFIKDISP